MTARWATFDCYGTLVDWNAGIGAELGRPFGSPVRERLLARYHVIEPRVQSEHPGWSYRQVMAAVLAELASEAGLPFRRKSKMRWAAPFPVGPCSPRCRARWPRPMSGAGGWSRSRTAIAA